MDKYVKTVQLDATPQEIYDAITTEKGLTSWWTQEITLYPQVGGIATFRFGKKNYVVMKITKLLSPKEVVWKCVEQICSYKDSERTDDWVGTTIKLAISVNKDKTTALTVTHNGLTPELESFPECEEEWNHYLESLKLYLETGKGKPFKKE